MTWPLTGWRVLAPLLLTAAAPEPTVEEIRANIEAQIRAADAARAAAPVQNGQSRSLYINNHQDTVGPLYPDAPLAPAGPAAVAVPSAPARPPELSFDRVVFAYGSDRLNPAAQPSLLKIASVIADEAYRGRLFLIVGHTDSIGGAVYNRNLSQRRALSVVGALARLGVPDDRLSPLGVGINEPIAGLPGTDPRNRRVEVRLYR